MALKYAPGISKPRDKPWCSMVKETDGISMLETRGFCIQWAARRAGPQEKCSLMALSVQSRTRIKRIDEHSG